MALSVTVDTRELELALSQLQRPKLDKAVALALSDTQKNTKTKAAAAIAKHMAVRSGTVKPRILTPFVREGQYTAIIQSSRKPIALSDFPSTRQNARGVYTRAWGKPQTIAHAFIATMKSGHRGAFIRTGNHRLPIKQLWGPTVAGTFATPDVATIILKTMRERVRFNLIRRLRAQVRRRA